MKAQVERFREAGVESVFGVLDRDEGNEATADRSILVIGSPGRYTLENYLFDPLLLAALLIREGRIANVEGLHDAVPSRHGTYRGLGEADAGTLQAVVEVMVQPLGLAEGYERRNCLLVGGAAIALPVELLDQPGHGLYKRWTEAVPPLRQFTTEDKLRSRILNFVVPELPQLLSNDHLDMMIELASA